MTAFLFFLAIVYLSSCHHCFYSNTRVATIPRRSKSFVFHPLIFILESIHKLSSSRVASSSSACRSSSLLRLSLRAAPSHESPVSSWLSSWEVVVFYGISVLTPASLYWWSLPQVDLLYSLA